MPDRERKDLETRRRIDELGASLEQWRERVDRRLGTVVWLVIVAVVIAMLAVLGTLGVLKRTDASAQRNTVALCALRVDVEARVVRNTNRLRRSELFLRDNPAGIPGITARVIRDGVNQQRAEIADQERTIKALKGIDCG